MRSLLRGAARVGRALIARAANDASVWVGSERRPRPRERRAPRGTVRAPRERSASSFSCISERHVTPPPLRDGRAAPSSSNRTCFAFLDPWLSYIPFVFLACCRHPLSHRLARGGWGGGPCVGRRRAGRAPFRQVARRDAARAARRRARTQVRGRLVHRAARVGRARRRAPGASGGDDSNERPIGGIGVVVETSAASSNVSGAGRQRRWHRRRRRNVVGVRVVTGFPAGRG